MHYISTIAVRNNLIRVHFFTGTISPPSSCDSPTTSVATTTSTTARRTTTVKTNTQMDYKKIYIPIICIFFMILVVIGALAAIVYQLRKKK